MRHITVLREEAVDALAIKASDSVVVDATFGSGGHAREILQRLGPDGVYIGIDADPAAIEAGKRIVEGAVPTVDLVVKNFRHLGEVLEEVGIDEVDAVLADLGWRIEQFEEGGRGFSFYADEPLLMTYGDPEDHLFTAKDIVNEWAVEDIANVLFGYGEEQFARRIAEAVVSHREVNGPIETALELSELIEVAVPTWYRRRRTHPATKTFQALRIAVNDEFLVLEEFIAAAYTHLSPGGRLAIITFHSLEDRIVKHAFREIAEKSHASIVTKKPITAGEAEITANPRARSAKLRVLEKTRS